MGNNTPYQYINILFTKFHFSPPETTKTAWQTFRAEERRWAFGWTDTLTAKNTKHSTNVWRVQTARRKNNFKGGMAQVSSIRHANQWLEKYIRSITGSNINHQSYLTRTSWSGQIAPCSENKHKHHLSAAQQKPPGVQWGLLLHQIISSVPEIHVRHSAQIQLVHALHLLPNLHYKKVLWIVLKHFHHLDDSSINPKLTVIILQTFSLINSTVWKEIIPFFLFLFCIMTSPTLYRSNQKI